MKGLGIKLGLTAVLLMCTASTALGTSIDYEVLDITGDRYTVEYTVINDTLSEDIVAFSIFFGEDQSLTDSSIPGPGLNFDNWDQYTNFSPDDWGIGTEPQPADWDSYSFEPSSIDLPAQFNSDAWVDGIAVGDSLGGFTVSFDWTGVGSLVSLYFEVYTASSWDAADWGYTEVSGAPPLIPEPSTIALLTLGITVGLGLLRRKK